MTISDSAFPSSKIFDLILQTIDSNEALKKKMIKQTNAIIIFNLTNKSDKTQSWYLDLKKNGAVGKGSSPSGPADITLNVSEENFGKLVDGSASAQRLFMSGKLKVKGNVMKAASIETVLKAAQNAKPKL